MHKAFEAWARVSGRTEKQLRRLSNGDYEVTVTHWEWQAWQAATRAAVPDGWKAVPMEPTPAMIKATGLEDDDVIADVNDLLTSAYREMLAAAPEAQT